ncbi:MAG: hypothetical protein IJE92_04455, partial [Clostridia bacterium]|nr:hypothetical protein [Clostridia bacterium]
VGLDDGIFPIQRSKFSERDNHEENRIMYVAVTRARERLYLTRANSRFIYGQHKPMYPSIFFTKARELLTPVRPPSTERQLADDSYLDKLNLQPTQKPINTGKTTSQIKQFKVGQMVEHATFGKGMILRMAGDIADVIFESVGKKSLNIRFAPLKILQ